VPRSPRSPVKNWDQYNELRRQGYSKQVAARTVNHEVKWRKILQKSWETRRQQG
jgi:hypothetical protein